MDIDERTVPHKYDTYIDLNHPPMKYAGFQKPKTDATGRSSRSLSEPVVMISTSGQATSDNGGGFNFHLGGLSRG